MRKIMLLLLLVANIVVYSADQPLTWQDLQKNVDSWTDGPPSLLLTKQESDVFHKLKSPEDKMEFIKIFWARRDPILRTRENEFKEEFYNRVDYANEHFAENKLPGWKSARGQVYVLFGPASREEQRSVEGSSRPGILWVYDKTPSSKIPPNEALLFVYRDFKYILMPPSPAMGDSFGEQQRAMELDSQGYQSIPDTVQQAFADVMQQRIVDEEKDYRGLLSSVTTTEKFGMEGIDFETSRVQDNPLQFKITLPKDSPVIYDAGTRLFLQLSIDQELKMGTTVLASRHETITREWDQKQFAGLESVQIPLQALEGKPGAYELTVTVKDDVSGISEARKTQVQ